MNLAHISDAHGVVPPNCIERGRNVLRLLPPLTAEPEVLGEGLARLERALGRLQP
ncbi:hypothetical protein [Halomonas caseinilytica]|uniref:Uncharacterized protein n=1 Tax=Halomonas caseinilytica TaxID=438744 RepID=A0A1M6WPF4_9GAMM|nr:hypothetical protein [Halomonas caseinilytica]SHK95617.1 hypothetical protein SAMN05192556_106224 [Halomonas caseinilytica]